MSLHLGLSPDHVPVPLYAWHAPRTSKVDLSILLDPVVEVDTDERRWMNGLVGGGQVAGAAGLPHLYVTDMLFNRVDVVDLKTLEITETLDLDYTPRAIHLDAPRYLLMVGGWLDGVVRLYRLSSLAPLEASAWVGPYLRDFAYDPTRGQLFAGSKCGVFQLSVDALAGTKPSN